VRRKLADCLCGGGIPARVAGDETFSLRRRLILAGLLARRPMLGLAVVLLSASCFATSSTLGRLSYDHGTNPLSVNATRVFVAACALALFLWARGVPAGLSRRERAAALGMGMVMGSYALALFQAIALIPVPVAILVFYTYPLLIGAVTWALGAERPSWQAGGAMLLGFAGVCLALDPGGGSIGLAGVGYAMLAACGFTAVVVTNGRLFRGRDSRPITLHLLAGALIVYAALYATIADYAAPRDGAGWALLLSLSLSYTVAVISLFTAVSAIGPFRTSLVMNWEPIASIILGALVLGQLLSPIQLAGAALVVVALVLVRRVPKPR
jgi:drug/metabolite transporter (DMT)-like permease